MYLGVDLMLKTGLLDEVESLKQCCDLSPMKTVGYQEFYDNPMNIERAVELVKRNSRRYAKRQITWFKKTPDIEWFEANELGEEIYKEKISSKLPEYSYKTIAQIVDEGVLKNFFIKLTPKVKLTKDLKIRNIRLSEDIIVGFINWKIDMLSSLIEFKKKI